MGTDQIFNIQELEEQLETPTVALTYWGSSHFTKRHGFQTAVTEIGGSWLPGHQAKHTFFATGGKQMSKSVVRDILYDISIPSSANQHICVLGLGDNDLRAGRREEDFLDDIKELVSKWKTEGRGYLIITSLLPCPKTERFLGKRFAKVSRKIKEMVKGERNIKYFSLARLFVTRQEELRTELYKDGLHLTDLGSLLVCSNLQSLTRQLINENHQTN